MMYRITRVAFYENTNVMEETLFVHFYLKYKAGNLQLGVSRV